MSSGVPPLPPRLRKEPQEHDIGDGKKYADWAAFDADLQQWQREKAERASEMKARRKAKEQEREKQRDRSGRQHAKDDSERRVRQRREKKQADPEHAADALAIRSARDLLAAARSRPLPRVESTSFDTLKALTQRFVSQGDRATGEQLVTAWESIMLRPCPPRCQFYFIEPIRCVGFGARPGDVYTSDYGFKGNHVRLFPAQRPRREAQWKAALGHDLCDGMHDISLTRGAHYHFSVGLFPYTLQGPYRLQSVTVGLMDQDDGSETIYVCWPEDPEDASFFQRTPSTPEDELFTFNLRTWRDESHSRWPGRVHHDEPELEPYDELSLMRYREEAIRAHEANPEQSEDEDPRLEPWRVQK